MPSYSAPDGIEPVLALTREIVNYGERLSRSLGCPESEIWSLYLAASGRMLYPGQEARGPGFPDAELATGTTTRYALWRNALEEVLGMLGPEEARLRTGFSQGSWSPVSRHTSSTSRPMTHDRTWLLLPDMSSMSDAARSAGVAVLEEAGSPSDVWSTWRPFILADATPTIRVPDDDEHSIDRLTAAWLDIARKEGLISPSGDFLISCGSHGGQMNPWLHVRLGERLDISVLGPDPTQPEFVASDLDRTVTMGVTGPPPGTRTSSREPERRRASSAVGPVARPGSYVWTRPQAPQVRCRSCLSPGGCLHAEEDRSGAAGACGASGA